LAIKESSCIVIPEDCDDPDRFDSESALLLKDTGLYDFCIEPEKRKIAHEYDRQGSSVRMRYTKMTSNFGKFYPTPDFTLTRLGQ
jgi:hypothetical protein